MDIVKSYNIVNVGENDAEINMYGEVVMAHPVDWWTGEKLPGNFIALDEFLQDLEELSTKDNITIHINSVGGDFYAGLAIYNRLTALDANIITINDSLAASAGSIILQAGNVRKVRAASNVMVHGVIALLRGYYNAQDLKKVIKQFDANNKALINAYVEASGQDADKVKSYVDKETWLTGHEAVDAGFADEVIDLDGKLDMSVAQNRSHMIVNGLRMSAQWMPTTLPNGISIEASENRSNPAAAPSGGNITDGGTNPMINTIDELREAYPELTAQLEAAVRADALAQGAADERARLEAIDCIRDNIGNPELVRNAMFGENAMTAEQLAFEALRNNTTRNQAVLGAMAADAVAAGQVATTPTPADDPAAIARESLASDLSAIASAVNTNKEEK